MTRTYRIAGVPVQVSTIYEDFHVLSRYYRVDGNNCSFSVSTTQEDIDCERSKSDSGTFPDSYLEALAVFRKISERIPQSRACLFHGSAISVDKLGYIFAAPSGTGKSTHAALWRELLGERSFMVNDDKPIIRINFDGMEVCGSPFNGKHGLGCNTHVPLRAICILRRGDENHIERISHSEAYPELLRQTYRPSDTFSLAQTLRILDCLKHGVRFYRLHCNMSPEAAKVSWEGMRP